MDSNLSPQDRKDLDKFVKFFALKAVQVIVQARLGDKICTRSSSSPTGSDWFNLAIKDIPEVTQEAKKALSGQLPAVGRSMCVEISLKTSEGDSMELEVWCLEMNEKCDRDIKVSYTVYNRLSLLLKSLLAVTRVTPAYRLSRKQGHEYVILYRIYFGDVQLLGLKEGFQAVRVGTVGTPIGTLTLTCAYRTNLAFMSTRQFERTQPIMGIIIDHFVDRPFPSTSHMHPCNYRGSEEQGTVYPAVEDSQDVCTTSFSTSPPSQCVFTFSKAQGQTANTVVTDSHRVLTMGLAFPHQLYSSRLSYQPTVLGAGSSEPCYQVALAAGVSATLPHQMMVPGKEGGLPNITAQPAHGTQAEHDRVLLTSPPNVTGTTSSSEEADTPSGSNTGGRSSSPNKPPHVLFTRKVGAFVDKPSPQVTYASNDIPFAVFAPKLADLEENDTMLVCPDSPEEVSPDAGSLQSSCSSSEVPQDDFVMVDFRPAFSKDDLPMDVGTFYREFQNPPQLSSLSIDIAVQSMAEDLDSLPEKLAMHEKNMEEFDAFVDSLQ
ncbi:PREDICTED: autophagy-related protein 13 isoform X1 [Nanorana parkeri]|uniref:autophagy-related protein 13 isoform X1 n=1 Tax=Nanorana parkeri TaxID=125878 RepID=UPI000854C1E7|nr:PREDICTED: autophagy-related protein 13 isoform X1 [Nanorana parkeri]